MITVNGVTLLDTQEAAEYIGQQRGRPMALETLKHHLYTAHTLEADAKIGHSLLFTTTTLDEFIGRIRKAGRPPKNPP
jgi:hypothetical protein